MQRERAFTCEDCGKPTRRRKRADRPNVCLDCGITRAVTQNRELAAAAGSRWDIHAWVATHPDGAIARLLREG